MIKIQNLKHGFRKLEFRISNLFRISFGTRTWFVFEFRILTQKGASLYLALIVMTVMLGIALGLSSIFIGQTKMIKQMGNSVIALGAADTGIEAVLLNRNNPVNIPVTALSNGATYQVVVATGGTGNCPAESYYCIKSIGSYLGTRRAVEIIY